MKTSILFLIIVAIGISLVTLVFVYQHIQNCETEGGSITNSLQCDKTNYDLIIDLFQKKYAPQGGSITDMANGAITEMISTSPVGNTMTLLIKENKNGPYSAEITCKYKSGKTERITENIVNYLKIGGCFMDDSFEFAPETAISSGDNIKTLNALTPSAPWTDYDRFAQILVNATHDTITEKRIDDEAQTVYTTQKGNLIIRKENTDNYSVMVDYSLDGTKIDRSRADGFVDSFMKKIGYEIDGTEKADRTDYGTHYRVALSQKNHGWIIQNHMAQFIFWQDNPSTYIRLGKWYDDTTKIELKVSQEQAKEIAANYVKSRLIREPEFNKNQPVQPDWVQIEIIDDSLVYVVSGGGFAINVLVDPVSGKVIGWKEPLRMD